MEQEKQKGRKNHPNRWLRLLYRHATLWLLILVVLLCLIGAIIAYFHFRGTIRSNDAFLLAERSQVASEILGRVIQIDVAEGESVHKGDVVCLLSNAELLSLLNQRRLEWEVAGVEERDLAGERLQGALLSQEQTILRSSIDGVVAKRWINLGDVLLPGQSVLTLYDLGTIWITAYINETQISRIAPGDAVTIKIDAYPKTSFSGLVEQIGVATGSQFSLIPPNNAAGNFTKLTQKVPIKIVFNEMPEGVRLIPGMSAEVSISPSLNPR